MLPQQAGSACPYSSNKTVSQGCCRRARTQCAPLAASRLPLTRLTAYTRESQRIAALKHQTQVFTADDSAFVALKALTPVCAADVATPESGVRGLVANSNLQEGQTVLFVPNTNSISVPTGGPKYVQHWHKSFLEPWERQHGALPQALVDFLADTHWDPTTRLSAWLLYLKQYRCSDSSYHCYNNSRSGELWDSWITLLPGLDEASNACGAWTPTEVQQLQLEPYKGVMSKVNSLTAEVCTDAFDHMQTGDLRGLQLAKSVDDVMWGAFVTRTRATSTGDAVTLRPMHDMLNHAESPNATCHLTNDGYVVETLTEIPRGTEITISYTGDEPIGSDLNLGTPSLELQMTWGFTLGPSAQDLILPMQYQALPGLCWGPVVAAAAAAVSEQGGQQQHRIGYERDRSDERLTMAEAVVGNMPLVQIDSSSSSSSSGSSGSATKLGPMYKRAAETISRVGMLGSPCSEASSFSTGSSSSSSSLLQFVSNSGGSPTAAWVPAGGSSSSSKVEILDSAVQQTPEWMIYDRPYLTQLQLRRMQSQFVSDVADRLPPLQRSLLLARSSVPNEWRGVASLLQLPLGFMHWVNNTVSDSLNPSSSDSSSSRRVGSSSSGGSSVKQDLQQQLLVARALACEVQFMLLQSGTCMEDDEILMQYLQQGVLKNPGGTVVAPAAAAAGLNCTRQQQQQQVVTSDSSTDDLETFKQRQVEILRQLMLLQAVETIEAWMPRAQAAAVIAAVNNRHIYAQQQQQQQGSGLWAGSAAVGSNVWLSPAPVAFVASTDVLPAFDSIIPSLAWNDSRSSSGSSKMATSTAAAAPLQVLTALTASSRGTSSSSRAYGSYSLDGWGSGSGKLEELVTALDLQEQQLARWQQQQQVSTSRSNDLAVAEARELLDSGQVCRSRYMAAVAARLQQKKLLHMYVEILEQVQNELKSDLARVDAA